MSQTKETKPLSTEEKLEAMGWKLDRANGNPVAVAVSVSLPDLCHRIGWIRASGVYKWKRHDEQFRTYDSFEEAVDSAYAAWLARPKPANLEDFLPVLRWHCPEDGDENYGHLELLATIADHVFVLAGLFEHEGIYWYEADTNAGGPNLVDALFGEEQDEVAVRVNEIRKELPKWAPLIPDVPADVVAGWKQILDEKEKQ